MFGAAVLFSLTLVLVFPYTWMQMLTEKDILDICKERADTLYRTHFQSTSQADAGGPLLDAAGAVTDANHLPINPNPILRPCPRTRSLEFVS